jgi:uncharacterized protein YjbI with pentapeptide repeats
MLSSQRLFIAAVFACAFAVPAVYAVSPFSPEDEARLKETGNCPGCSLTGANLQGVGAAEGDLTGADFSGANLYMANFRGADLSGANFNGADLTGAQMIGAKSADLTGATTTSRTQCPSGAAGPCS